MARQEELDFERREKDKALDRLRQIEEGELAYCTICGKILNSSKFYKSLVPNIDKNGLMHQCSNCLVSYCNNILDETDGNYEYAILQTCKLSNITFDQTAFDMMQAQRHKSSATGRVFAKAFGVYKSKLSSTAKANGSIGTTFADTVLTENISSISKSAEVYSDEWVGTYAQKDIDDLNKYYTGLCQDYNIITINHKDYARKIAKASLMMDREYEKLLNGNGNEGSYERFKKIFDDLCKSAQFSESMRGKSAVGNGISEITQTVENHGWIYAEEEFQPDDLDLILKQFSNINKSL